MRLWYTRVTSRWSVVPVSPGRPVWCVGKDSHRPKGPFMAVAIATLLEDVSTSYRGDGALDAPYEVGRAERQAETSIEVGDVRVLVLPDDFAAGEGPWLPRHGVYFSLEAAEAALAARSGGGG